MMGVTGFLWCSEVLSNHLGKDILIETLIIANMLFILPRKGF